MEMFQSVSLMENLYRQICRLDHEFHKLNDTMASIKDPTKQSMLKLKLVEALEEELPECSSDEEEEGTDEYID